MPDSQRSNAFATETLAQYTPRAAAYDTAAGGWHAELGRDFVTWLPSPEGGTVLDLACGTGLVSLPYAGAVGSDGIVIAIDITEAMLDEAKRKPHPIDNGEIKWLLGDITALSSIATVQEVVRSRGGFDVISCCSAFVLLENPAQAVRDWVPFLKSGTGRLIIDVPTGDHTLMYLINHQLRKALGMSMVYDFEWDKDIHTLEKIYGDAGLEVEKSFCTRSYLPEKWYTAEQAGEVFEEKIAKTEVWENAAVKLESQGEEDGMDKIRQIWDKIWEENLNDEGRLWDGHALYVTIGRRRV